MGKSARRIEALRAMAEQSESPEEAAIAREKLALLESRLPDPELLTWQQQQALEAERQRAAEEAVYADIVRRWEHGEFSDIDVRPAATTKVRYRASKKHRRDA